MVRFKVWKSKRCRKFRLGISERKFGFDVDTWNDIDSGWKRVLIGNLDYERIKCRDRAAHRGRPVVDVLLCLTGLITDREVYPDLYEVNPGTMK